MAFRLEKLKIATLLHGYFTTPEQFSHLKNRDERGDRLVFNDEKGSIKYKVRQYLNFQRITIIS